MAIGGKFIPRNPQKYAGDLSKIFFRSTWELKVMQMFDSNPTVLKWASETLKIPYISPVDKLVHTYYPDFIVIYTDRNGNIQKEIVEVKPLTQTLAEKAKSDADKIKLIVNDAKWKAASQFAQSRGMTFRVITERSIFIQAQPKVKRPKAPSKARKPIGTRGTTR